MFCRFFQFLTFCWHFFLSPSSFGEYSTQKADKMTNFLSFFSVFVIFLTFSGHFFRIFRIFPNFSGIFLNLSHPSFGGYSTKKADKMTNLLTIFVIFWHFFRIFRIFCELFRNVSNSESVAPHFRRIFDPKSGRSDSFLSFVCQFLWAFVIFWSRKRWMYSKNTNIGWIILSHRKTAPVFSRPAFFGLDLRRVSLSLRRSVAFRGAGFGPLLVRRSLFRPSAKRSIIRLSAKRSAFRLVVRFS